MTLNTDLTILIPVKNEEKNVIHIINEIENKIKINYEILFVNDFSTDRTYELIEDLKNDKKNIFVVNNLKGGLGESVKNGMKYGNGKYLVILMCDASDDLNDLNKYFQEIENNNLDAVFGSRFLDKSKVEGYPKMKLFLNRIFNYLISLLYLNKYNDYTNAFKIYKKDTLIKLEPIVSESFNVFLEIPLKIINRNYKYKIIPINWFGRKIGKSKFKFNELKSKYIFTLIYCFAEKILILNKANKNDSPHK
ncbi:glycosyltransferase family 2 protein [bacterium]|jgi:dolichol-phosphate mannosyltransferase|nr:glycosyltransferase family 2 protein [bacterium]MDC1140395.1 glycosyltransferase family 2 protein [Candidatus Pelagibacter sp.]